MHFAIPSRQLYEVTKDTNVSLFVVIPSAVHVCVCMVYTVYYDHNIHTEGCTSTWHNDYALTCSVYKQNTGLSRVTDSMAQ